MNTETEAWEAFVEMRRQKGKRAPFTLAAEKRIRFELRRLQADGHDAGEVLWQSVVNGWSGVFPVKGRKSLSAPSVDATAEYLKREAEHAARARFEAQARKART